MEMERVKIELTVNGRKVCKYVAPAMRLADFLREELHLIGTKKGCNAGECGTCSVLIDGVLKKSCLIPVMKANHREIVTIEGIGKAGLSYYPEMLSEGGGCPMWILHTGNDYGSYDNIERKQTSGQSGDQKKTRWKYLPVHWICEDY